MVFCCRMLENPHNYSFPENLCKMAMFPVFCVIK
jgi:hypothetical protein